MRGSLLVVVAAVAGCARPEPADLILKNATVHTGDPAKPTAEAIAIKGRVIQAVGTNAEILRRAGSNTRVVDLHGATALPGFADAHYHLSGVGERELVLNLEGTTTKEAFLAKLKERVATTPKGQWIVGRGWIETFWVPQVFPSRRDLDPIAPDNPVFLTRADGHAAIVNSKALALAALTRGSQAPFGGALNRDPAGELTGMLIDNAQELVAAKIPAPTATMLDSAIVVGADRSVRLGWTEIQNAGGSWDDVARMRRLYGAGTLKLRIYQAIHGPSPAADSLLRAGASVGEYDGRLTVRTIKTVFDGALGSRGALLLAPYADDPASTGLLTTDTAQYRPMLVHALERGVQVETHAIGDRANRLVLDFYEQAMKAVPPASRSAAKEPRWRIEHAQIVDPADRPRFKALGVIPSMQPSHAVGDLYFAPARLGTARLAGAYSWHSFVELGLPVAGGSDAPVERGEPMIEFHAAVTRKDVRGRSGPDADWHPEEKVSRDEALKMFTRYAAFAAFEEDRRGSIEPGKWADLTILDHDIMTIPEADILTTLNIMTVIGGEIVYRADRR
jgi:predicted amidohydrolase YtcJ